MVNDESIELLSRSAEISLPGSFFPAGAPPRPRPDFPNPTLHEPSLIISAPWRRDRVLALAGLHAQTTPGTCAKKSDEVISLSEFTVKAESDRGYIASETMTGSRVKTQIADLPYTVNVLTSEFFEDFAIFELSDNVVQIGGFTGLDGGGGFNLRGFSSSSQLRDGFFRLGRYGSSNVDRMEIIKGSNAAIYGRTSPGGMLNMVSKQPKARASQRSYNYGDEGTQRSSRAPPPVRLATSTSSPAAIIKEFDREYARNRNQEYPRPGHDFRRLQLVSLGRIFSPAAPRPQQLRAPHHRRAPRASTTRPSVTPTISPESNAFGPISELTAATPVSMRLRQEAQLIWSTRGAKLLSPALGFQPEHRLVRSHQSRASPRRPITRTRRPQHHRIIEDGGSRAIWPTIGQRPIEHRTSSSTSTIIADPSQRPPPTPISS